MENTNNTQNLVDGLVQQITTTNSVTALNQTLRSGLRAEVREATLAGALSSGEDPLNVLDPRNDTLGILYILSARLNLPYDPQRVPAPPSWDFINDFTANFIPEQARHAPDRVSQLANGIAAYANHSVNPKWAVIPLFNLATRYPPTPSTLTTIHHQALLIALQTGHISPVVDFLVKHPIDDILSTAHLPNTRPGDSPTTELSYTDNLIYQYMAGMVLTLAAIPFSSEINPATDHTRPSQVPPPPPNFRLLTHALSYFENCITAPAASQNTPPSAIQLEALKKLRLLQCIRYGGPKSLPKYAHPSLNKLWKSSGKGLEFMSPALPPLPGATVTRDGRDREERGGNSGGGGYAALTNAFPGSIGSISSTGFSSSTTNPNALHPIRTLALKDRALYEHDQNWGLVLRVVAEAESGRWQVKKLTESYVRLGLEEIGKALGWIRETDPRQLKEIAERKVRTLLMQMIESKTINASISADDVVTFHDNSPEIELEELLLEFGEPPAGQQTHTLSSVLSQVQAQTEKLEAIDAEISRSKKFLTQVLKSSSGGGAYGSSYGQMGPGGGFGGIPSGFGPGLGGMSMDDDDMMGGGFGGGFGDDGMYS